MNEEPTHNAQDADDEQPSLSDTIFVGVGMPGVMAARVMRTALVDEILAALLRENILTKEQLSQALSRGENGVQEMAQPLKGKGGKSDEAAQNMEEMAAAIKKRLTDKFIDELPPPSEPEQ
ncbi:MAG: hypothetical protein QOE77_1962 [Blastocatellia bacterium]|jgi:hypothetical protein|nr:hypothetical protein [Blastocatellia bacterium]